jgi:hypothetical protein
LPRALSKTDIFAASGPNLPAGADPANGPSLSVRSGWRQASLTTDPFGTFGNAIQPPLTPASPPAYTYGSPSAHPQLVQNPPNPPSSFAPRRQTSSSAIKAERSEQRSPTSTQLRSKSSSGTLALQSQSTGTTPRQPQSYPPPKRQGAGDPSSSASPLSSRTATSSGSTARKKVKCRTGEHDFESKFGVSGFSNLSFLFAATRSLNLCHY